MTWPNTTSGLTGAIALLERAMGYSLGGVLLVTPEAMANRTPCRDWDLRTLLVHLNDSLLALDEAIAVGHLRLDPAGRGASPTGGGNPASGDDEPAGDPVTRLRVLASRLIGRWVSARPPATISIGGRELSPEIVAATGAVEVAVHGWDLIRACGHDRPVPPALAAELLELCQLFVIDADRPSRFAAPVSVPPLASPSDRLVAFLGRDPG